ncbi:MAG: response regulator [gamma proteobacterium symbiont of Phacoides pectinatus]
MLGFQADFAENGVQALEKWRHGRYSLIMTDCHMPEMDGYQLTRTIRGEEPDGTRIPVVAITADALKGTAQRCRAAGMDDYLTKPMQLKELSQALKRWLPMGHAGGGEPLSASAGGMAATPLARSLIPWSWATCWGLKNGPPWPISITCSWRATAARSNRSRGLFRMVTSPRWGVWPTS